MLKKIRILIWFLRKPELYKELIRKLKQRFIFYNKEKEESYKIARDWCRKKQLTTKEALTKHLLTKQNYKDINLIYPKIFEVAREKEKKCPEKMGGATSINLLYHLCEEIKAEKVLETGVAYGWSSLSILLSLKKRGGTLVSTDMPYYLRDNEQFVGTIIPEELQKYWTLIQRPDLDILPKLKKEGCSFDLCHYDSDKTYAGRIQAYPLLWDMLNTGGYLISDDIADNVGFKDFSEKVKRKPLIVKKNQNFCGIIKK